MINPSLTVITVVLNGEDSLEQTILSVKSQNCYSLKYIIIDGGSTDKTLDIIRKHEDGLAHWRSQRDRGIYDAMNTGWQMVEQDSYVLFLGSGDKLLSLPDLSLYRESDVIFGDVYIGDKLFVSHTGFRLMLGNTVHHQALMVKKSVHTMPPFNLDYRIYSDFDFNQRLYKRGIKFRKVAGFISYASEGGVSAHKDEKEMLKIVRKNYGVFFVLIARIYYFIQNVR